MALRHLASRYSAWKTAGPALARAASSAPKVADKIVTVTVVDQVGRRHVLRGLEGQSIVDVVQENSSMFSGDVVCLSPEGQGRGEMHVKVPNEMEAHLPMTHDDTKVLGSVAAQGTIDKHSRLGSRVILSKDKDNMLVAIGALAPWAAV